ncbi:uncharacterized protein LOC110728765 [Chenopodium quinoa]|uniref:uncharacterized protein LOC110728765 n=1 Tax=Chenopodium quinoa TaxID=63459 RepID=UPI000B798283|nr:uncharacterized protein LOC110728765 [Chenopodium quinoa]
MPRKSKGSGLFFEVEYLKDSDEAGSDDGGYDESSGDESDSDDVDSTAGDYEVDEDVEEDGVGSEEEPEQDKVSYQGLLCKLLLEKVEKGKRKRGYIEKRTGKKGKLKDPMARTKRNARVTDSDDSFYAPVSEISDVPRGALSTPNDSIIEESGEKVQNDIPGFVDLANQADPRSESLGSDSEPSTSSKFSDDSEEGHFRLETAREPLSVEMGEDWAEPSATRREQYAPTISMFPQAGGK